MADTTPATAPGARDGFPCPACIDVSAPVVSRHSVTVTASADAVWRILTDIDEWTTWLPEIPYARVETPGPPAPGSVFRWSAAGMEIESTSVQVRPQEATASEAAQFSSHSNCSCPNCPPARSTFPPSACQHLGVTQSRFVGAVRSLGVDHSHPYVKLDRDMCIACNRCVRMCAAVQGTFALSLAGRGFDTVVAAGTGGEWVSSPCVGCGGCVDTCPSGALSEPGLLDVRPISRTTRAGCDRAHLLRPGNQ